MVGRVWKGLQVSSILLRVLVVILCIAAFNSWTLNSTSGTFEVRDPMWTCFVFAREVPEVSIKVGPEISVVKQFKFGDGGKHGPCKFGSIQDFQDCVSKMESSYYPYWSCDDKEIDWSEGTAESATIIASIACVSFTVLLMGKVGFVILEWQEHTWTKEANNKLTKGIVFLITYWMGSFLPTFVLSPVTAMKTYGDDELKGAAEVTVHGIHTAMMIVGPLVVVYYFIVLGGRQCVAERTGGAQRCGWCVIFAVPALGMLAHLLMLTFLMGFPTFDFTLLFGFNLSFSMAFIADIVQVILFVVALMDLVAMFIQVAGN